MDTIFEEYKMNHVSLARLDLHLHFVHVNNDAQNVARNLLEMTGFDIKEHFSAIEF